MYNLVKFTVFWHSLPDQTVISHSQSFLGDNILPLIGCQRHIRLSVITFFIFVSMNSHHLLLVELFGHGVTSYIILLTSSHKPFNWVSFLLFDCAYEVSHLKLNVKLVNKPIATRIRLEFVRTTYQLLVILNKSKYSLT